MIFFTSDEHFGHRNTLQPWHCGRPFSSVEEMDEEIIRRHNAKVGPNDIVYREGDMFWRTNTPERVNEIIQRLNGEHKFYVRGNHEEAIRKAKGLFFMPDIYHIYPIGGPKSGIVLSHRPLRSWESREHGSWHLYGHIHSKVQKNTGLSMDVGVDANNFAPVSLDEVADYMRGRRVDQED